MKAETWVIDEAGQIFARKERKELVSARTATAEEGRGETGNRHSTKNIWAYFDSKKIAEQSTHCTSHNQHI